MSDETQVSDGRSEEMQRVDSSGISSSVRLLLDGWVSDIHKKRESSSGYNRIIGFLKQVLTEFFAYSIVGVAFAALLYVLSLVSPFRTMLPSVWVAFPLTMGATISTLFLATWDSWLRPSNEDAETESREAK